MSEVIFNISFNSIQFYKVDFFFIHRCFREQNPNKLTVLIKLGMTALRQVMFSHFFIIYIGFF